LGLLSRDNNRHGRIGGKASIALRRAACRLKARITSVAFIEADAENMTLDPPAIAGTLKPVELKRGSTQRINNCISNNNCGWRCQGACVVSSTVCHSKVDETVTSRRRSLTCRR
jgi:hypothetical protein